MSAVFFLPQNLMLVIIILTIKNLDFFEKILLTNIIVFYFIHVNTLMYAEYLTPILPLLLILAIRKWDQFLEKSKFLKKISYNSRIKLVIIVYIVFIPFGITYLKAPFLGGSFMYNPVQLKLLLTEINSIDGKYILSCWEGYSVYSNKIPIAADQYQPGFLSDIYDSLQESLREKVLLKKDYVELIRTGKADIIVYEINNPVHLTGLKEYMERYYFPTLVKEGVIVYVKKRT
jgi:hypothetical protein